MPYTKTNILKIKISLQSFIVELYTRQNGEKKPVTPVADGVQEKQQVLRGASPLPKTSLKEEKFNIQLNCQKFEIINE